MYCKAEGCLLEELRVIGNVPIPSVREEFPSVRVSTDVHAIEVDLRASQWLDDGFDTFAFDAAIDDLAGRPFVLSIADDRGHEAFAFEVLNRCQRWISRRNRDSESEIFDRVLRRHREMHDISRPLVRADYNHARDVWQWTLRLDPHASLAVQIAALFHDIENARRALLEIGVHADTLNRVTDLAAVQERKSCDPEIALVNDADALSFFSLSSTGFANEHGAEQTKNKIEYTFKRMTDRARARLNSVRLRGDVRKLLDGVRGSV